MVSTQEFEDAAQRILLGESLAQIAIAYRDQLLVEMGFDPADASDDLFRKETSRYINQLCRHLGDRHAGSSRIAAALEVWVRSVEDYDAFDTLLSHYDFDGRDSVLRRGKVLFPGPLTAHWGDSNHHRD